MEHIAAMIDLAQAGTTGPLIDRSATGGEKMNQRVDGRRTLVLGQALEHVGHRRARLCLVWIRKKRTQILRRDASAYVGKIRRRLRQQAVANVSRRVARRAIEFAQQHSSVLRIPTGNYRVRLGLNIIPSAQPGQDQGEYQAQMSFCSHRVLLVYSTAGTCRTTTKHRASEARRKLAQNII
jgi:hypothetical protein